MHRYLIPELSVEALEVSHIPFPQQDVFSLFILRGEKKNDVTYNTARFVSLSLAVTLQELFAKFAVFQIPGIASS